MLTPHQRRALAREGHLTVTANAGSGKTRVLVDRYLDVLLKGHAAVSEVVALTYTDKAAGELRRKIAERLSVAAAGAVPATLRRLEEIREQLPGAVIGTIHAFCARLLREHPIEAGVDAGFSVIEGLDQHVLLNEAMRETFHAILRENVGPREALVELVRRLGKESAVDAVRVLVERRERLERLNGPGGVYARPDTEILDLWQETLRQHAETRLSGPSLQRDLRAILAALDGKGRTPLLDLGRALDDDDQAARWSAIPTLLRKLLTQKGTLFAALATPPAAAGVRSEVSRAARLRDELLPLLDSIDSSASGETHRRLLSLSRSILDIVQRVVEVYDLKKRETGTLDFEDLQLHTRALLRRENIRRTLAERYKFVMVDEYQDTNRLQYEILLPLVSHLQGGNLFVVGDPKQSIYGFRDADVRVFNQTRLDIAAASDARSIGENGQDARAVDPDRPTAGTRGNIVLGESFRPLRDLIAFVNLVFGALMKKEGEFDVEYEPLVRARRNPAPGRVEILLGGEGSGEASEGERIARRILDLVACEYAVHDADERPRPAKFQDFALLLRSRTHLAEIESAFVRAGVPYVVTGGVGYFQTQDVLDVFNYLQWLLDPSDDIALAGILRSPFFTVSDTELFDVGRAPRGGTLWEELCRRTDLAESLTSAVATLKGDRAVALRQPSPEVISRILRRSQYLVKLTGTAREAQAHANLEKLQRMARSYDLRGFVTLYDFTRRLKRLIDEEESEGQGVIESQADAVRIMTVHAAKGLEFPVVVLPHLHRAIRADEEPFIDERLGLAFSYLDDRGEAADPPITRYLKSASRRRTDAEEKRIFYVACTRAREMLILSGNGEQRRGGRSWMGWMLEALDWESAASEPPRQVSSLVFRCQTAMLEFDGETYRRGEEEHELLIPVLRNPVPPSIRPGETAPGAGAMLPVIRARPLTARARGEIYSATRIRTYHECPAKYYIRYVLGLPDESRALAAMQPGETDDAEFPGETRGRIFHAVMQRIDSLPPGRASLTREAMRVLSAERRVEGAAVESLIGDVVMSVEQVLASHLWEEAGGGAEVRTEFTISSVLDDDYISGTMDRVYRDAGGAWHVLDYKTDRVDATTLAARAEGYWPQLKFYSLLVHRYFSASEVTGTLLFTSLPGTPLRRTFGAEELLRFEDEIRWTITRIKAGDFRPTQVPCLGCPFAPQGCTFLR